MLVLILAAVGGAGVTLGVLAIIRGVTGRSAPETEHVPHPDDCGSYHWIGSTEHWCRFHRGHKGGAHACAHCNLTWPRAKE